MMRPLTLGLLSSTSASRSVRNRLLARLREQGPLMAGGTAELAAFSSMSHGSSPFRSEMRRLEIGTSVVRSNSTVSYAGGRGRHPHAQPQAQLGELLLHFVQRGFAEVANFEQLIFGAA